MEVGRYDSFALADPLCHLAHFVREREALRNDVWRGDCTEAAFERVYERRRVVRAAGELDSLSA